MAEEGEEAAADFGLPGEVMAADPFEQLDVARKITSIALASRLGRLEAEAARLREQLAERDAAAEDLRERVEQLDAALALASDRLSRAEEEKETLLNENATLSNTIKKLNRDVAKCEGCGLWPSGLGRLAEGRRGEETGRAGGRRPEHRNRAERESRRPEPPSGRARGRSGEGLRESRRPERRGRPPPRRPLPSPPARDYRRPEPPSARVGEPEA